MLGHSVCVRGPDWPRLTKRRVPAPHKSLCVKVLLCPADTDIVIHHKGVPGAMIIDKL